MDEETTKAIEEAMNIFHANTQEQQEPGATPDDEHEEERANEEQEQQTQEQAPPTLAEPEPGETEESTHPGNTRRWLSIAGLIIGSMSVTMLVMLVIVPLFRPSAIVTIIPSVTTMQTTTTIQVQSRALSMVTLTQARTVPTSGTGHQDAQAAHGLVTFFNAAPTVQTVTAGTVLTGRDGIQVAIDQDAVIPAGNLSTNGQMTVSAHVLQAGPAGNIGAGDIYGACCRADVLVANAAFTGGQDARTFQMVTQSDLDNAITPLKTATMQSINAAFQTQLHQGEAIAPPTCSTKTTSDHQAGEEASQVSASITAMCTAQAYESQDLQTQVTESITRETKQLVKCFAAGYSA